MKIQALCNADRSVVEKGKYKISASEQVTIGDVEYIQGLTRLYNDWEIQSNAPLLK